MIAVALRSQVVQDAVVEIAQGFPPFYASDDGTASGEVIRYLMLKGFAADVAAEAVAQHMRANEP